MAMMPAQRKPAQSASAPFDMSLTQPEHKCDGDVAVIALASDRISIAAGAKDCPTKAKAMIRTRVQSRLRAVHVMPGSIRPWLHRINSASDTLAQLSAI
jgi:hypothetical protein